MKIACRKHCGACCEIVSISSPLPGMPDGKPAFVACVNLDQTTRKCKIWGREDYPKVCREFTPDTGYCGRSTTEAFRLLSHIERETTP